jgi:hypothetical protein
MNETTHIHPQDFIDMLQRSERLGAYKTLHWIAFQFTDDMTAQDIVKLVDSGLASLNEEIYADFKKEHFIITDLSDIIEKRKQKEKETETQ